MWQEILNTVISNGIFATLFVLLLLYLLKDSAKREDKYTETISSLNKNLNAVEGIEGDVVKVKETVNETSGRVLDVKESVEKLNDKMDETSKSINSIDKDLKGQTKIVKKVSSDVKVVKEDVKEMKKIIFPKTE